MVIKPVPSRGSIFKRAISIIVLLLIIVMIAINWGKIDNLLYQYANDIQTSGPIGVTFMSLLYLPSSILFFPPMSYLNLSVWYVYGISGLLISVPGFILGASLGFFLTRHVFSSKCKKWIKQYPGKLLFLLKTGLVCHDVLLAMRKVTISEGYFRLQSLTNK